MILHQVMTTFDLTDEGAILNHLEPSRSGMKTTTGSATHRWLLWIASKLLHSPAIDFLGTEYLQYQHSFCNVDPCSNMAIRWRIPLIDVRYRPLPKA